MPVFPSPLPEEQSSFTEQETQLKKKQLEKEMVLLMYWHSPQSLAYLKEPLSVCIHLLPS